MRQLFLPRFCFFMLMFYATLGAYGDNQHPLSHQIDYIIDTDIGGDIDDVIALLLAVNSENKPLAITTSHIDPFEKAKIAKLILTETGFPNIPVYAGLGSSRTAPSEDFTRQNSLWPPFYGYPNPQPHQKAWYLKQALAYREEYGAKFDSMVIQQDSAAAFIVKAAQAHSPDLPLVIVALGPLHNIDLALALDPSIQKNILLYSMGGNYPKGYNWLISPETTARVLARVKTVCISSEFIEHNNLQVTPEEFKLLEQQTTSRLGRAILADWKNWYKIDATSSKFTRLSDPVTLFLALNPQYIVSTAPKKIAFPCLDEQGALKPEFSNCWYSMPGLENKIITIVATNQHKTEFVEQTLSPEKIKARIMQAIFSNIL